MAVPFAILQALRIQLNYYLLYERGLGKTFKKYLLAEAGLENMLTSMEVINILSTFCFQNYIDLVRTSSQFHLIQCFLKKLTEVVTVFKTSL